MHYGKVSLAVLSSLFCFSTLASAATLTFDLKVGEIASSDVSPIHFTAGGNDFGGVIVWRQTEDENITISTDNVASETYNCSRKIRGLYYNSQRGERLWPLDYTTADVLGYLSGNLLLEGGLYTSCQSGDVGDPYGIYGVLTHTFNGRDYNLLAGVKYGSISGNIVQNSSNVAPTLQRLDNKFPIGFLYDYNGGIGLVGCKLTGNATDLNDIIREVNMTGVNNTFKVSEDGYPMPVNSTWNSVIDCREVGMTLDQLLLLKIQGIIGMSTESSSDTSALAGNERDAKTQYFSSVNVNNATLVNYAKKRAEELCRGKWSQSKNSNPEVICWDGGNGSWSMKPSDLKNKTLIVRNGSVILTEGMTDADIPLDIFIDKGRLLLDLPTTSLQNFNDKGYLGAPSVAEGIYLKGTFIVNGVVSSTAGIKHKVYLHGKFTSLNTYSTPTDTRINQINELFGLKLTSPLAVKTEDIDLTKVFSWRCNYGNGSDGTACPLSEFQNAPLIIINQNYASKLTE